MILEVIFWIVLAVMLVIAGLAVGIWFAERER